MVWQKGQSGNPKGSTRGVKQIKEKLNNNFLRALSTAFEEQGTKAIDRLIKEDPGAFLKIIASISPKEIEVTTYEGLTIEQLDEVIYTLQSGINAGLIEQSAITIDQRAEVTKLPAVY